MFMRECHYAPRAYSGAFWQRRHCLCARVFHVVMLPPLSMDDARFSLHGFDAARGKKICYHAHQNNNPIEHRTTTLFSRH